MDWPDNFRKIYVTEGFWMNVTNLKHKQLQSNSATNMNLKPFSV
jgi:hypothetical protein